MQNDLSAQRSFSQQFFFSNLLLPSGRNPPRNPTTQTLVHTHTHQYTFFIQPQPKQPTSIRKDKAGKNYSKPKWSEWVLYDVKCHLRLANRERIVPYIRFARSGRRKRYAWWWVATSGFWFTQFPKENMPWHKRHYDLLPSVE